MNARAGKEKNRMHVLKVAHSARKIRSRTYATATTEKLFVQRSGRTKSDSGVEIETAFRAGSLP